MKWKRVFGVIIISATLLVPTLVGAAEKFTDVGPRFAEEISYLSQRNVVKGYNNGTFGVNNAVTRGEAVVMLVREMGLRLDGAPDPGFTDFKKGDGFYTEVAEAVEQGIIQGKTRKDGSRYFDPKGSLSRSEMALILTRAYDIPLDRMEVNFKDVPPQMPAKNAIDALANGGISFGYDDFTFKPYASITRQEFALFLARTVNRDFNRMVMQFVPYDPITHQRVKPVWLTEKEISEKEAELAKLINDVRVTKGFPALKNNERLFEMARLKSRALSRFPYEEYVFEDYPDFYKALYSDNLMKPIGESFAGGSVERAFSRLSSDQINEQSIYDQNQTDIGIGLAQNMDGSYNWCILIMYE